MPMTSDAALRDRLVTVILRPSAPPVACGIAVAAAAIAVEFDRDPAELDVQIFAGVMAGARLAAQSIVEREPGRSYVDTLDAVLARLEQGVPLADLPLPAAGRPRPEG